MTRTIVSIVEGDGEVIALPVLLRRLWMWRSPHATIEIARPIRVRRNAFLQRSDEFRRMLLLAAAKAGANGAVLVLLDADDDCPAKLGPTILQRARSIRPEMPMAAVIANREYEAWFIAAAASLQGVRGFAWDGIAPVDPDLPRNAKGWMRERVTGARYSPVSDQAAFSERLDLHAAFEHSRSFRKLASAWDAMVAAPTQL